MVITSAKLNESSHAEDPALLLERLAGRAGVNTARENRWHTPGRDLPRILCTCCVSPAGA